MRLPPVSERAGFQRFVAVLAVAVGVVGMSVAANYRPDTLRAGEARLEVDGRAQVVRADGDIEIVDGSTIVGRGDEVTATRGTMRLLFRSGAELEGRAASRVDVRPTEVRVGAAPELMGGSLLVESDTPFEMLSAGNQLRFEPADGAPVAARLERSLALAAAAYSGTIHLDSAGQERTIPALRELAVAVLGGPPPFARALSYDEADPWDMRFLGPAMELGRRLDALSGAYSESLDPGEGRTVGFYHGVLPSLVQEVSFSDSLLDPNREPGETLVGAAIAGRGERASFVERWTAVFEFRNLGARWGLVALDQGVDADPLIADIQSALNATPFEFAGPPSVAVDPAAPPISPPAPEDGSTVTGSGGETPRDIEPPPEPDSEPPPAPADGAPSQPEPTPADPVQSLLPDLPPLPVIVGPTPEGENGLVSDLVGPLLETLTAPVNSLLGGLLSG